MEFPLEEVLVPNDDPRFQALMEQISREIEPKPGVAELMGDIALASLCNPVCWVAVEGIRSPIPITRHMRSPGPNMLDEPMRMRIPSTAMYLQFYPSHDVDIREGAALYYPDVEGGKVVTRHDRVWYGTQRRLPLAPGTPSASSPPLRMAAFSSENDARRMLGLLPR